MWVPQYSILAQKYTGIAEKPRILRRIPFPYSIKNQFSTGSASVLGERSPVSKSYSKAFILAEEIIRTGESLVV